MPNEKASMLLEVEFEKWPDIQLGYDMKALCAKYGVDLRRIDFVDTFKVPVDEFRKATHEAAIDLILQFISEKEDKKCGNSTSESLNKMN